jgi:cAMP-binding proteins - catabolite gene activator and regulatory subunit of cAMP-dependent protein kinases
MNELIKKIDFFSGLDDKILNKISDACIARQFTRNETIVRQGEMGLGLYIIARGRVKVDREQGGVRTQVAELGPEQFFGDMALLDNKPRSATVTGIEDSECLLLTRDSFIRLMNKYPEIPIRMAKVLAERLREANAKIVASPAVPAPVVVVEKTEKVVVVEPASGTVPPPVTGPIPTAAANGASAPPADSTKAQIHRQLLETFQSLYMLKALSRFSVAVLGCPVEGTASNVVEQFRVGDVKALFFAAGEPVEMDIAAREPGWFTLDVFTPFSQAPYHFGPLAVDPGDPVRMTLASGAVTLRHRGE